MADHVFYDGDCGFCHGSVHFLATRDREGAFRFAPLGGVTFAALVPGVAAESLPDSLVVRTAEGRLLVESAAVLHCMRRLGGVQRTLAKGLALLPRRWLDAAYVAFARNRKRWFGGPEHACPVPPGELRARLDP